MAISAFVISYNRAWLLETCLRSLRFADELIVIDKSSTDGSRRVARRYADQVITVPWSPTVEDTRAFALQQCRHEWVVFLDDDEMLSPAAITFLHAPRDAGAADAVALPLRQWILGVFDPGAYYWPEHHVRFFRKGAVTFQPIVHGGTTIHSDRIEQVPADSPIYIEHLSHADAAGWVERTNRYTSRRQRVRVEPEAADLIAFAHRRIDHWVTRSGGGERGGYTDAVALLRAIYDMVDRLKSWEEARGLSGSAAFRARCAELQQAYDALERQSGIPTRARKAWLPAWLRHRRSGY